MKTHLSIRKRFEYLIPLLPKMLETMSINDIARYMDVVAEEEGFPKRSFSAYRMFVIRAVKETL